MEQIDSGLNSFFKKIIKIKNNIINDKILKPPDIVYHEYYHKQKLFQNKARHFSSYIHIYQPFF